MNTHDALKHSSTALSREHYLASPPKEKSTDDCTLWAFALLGAFACGVGITLILALGARVEGLKRQLDREQMTPAVIVVERTVGHE